VPELQLRIEESGPGTGTLSWQGDSDPDDLIRAVSAAAEEALADGTVRRLEISVPAGDHFARRAAVRSGFRLEGVRRSVLQTADGGLSDVLLFGRLVTDAVSGPTGFSGVMNAALPKKRLIAHVLMRDPDGRILLCETRFKPDWELPGGIVEPGEPPRVAAEREVLEELGIDLAIGRLLVVDWMPPYLGWEDAMELIFDGGVVTAEQLERYVLQASEIIQIRLCTLEEARELVTPLSYRRLTVASGLTAPATVYLENGSLPGS
jgi:8-oxo-dGTP pyrophosphatase MutT (NUDIX family)